jgi:TolA-binding protein
MAALVMAVNPRVKFTNEQIEAILDEVFRTYAEFILEGPKGLTFQGLLRTYDDGAGDVDRDFDALGLQLDSSSAVGNGTTPQEPYITVAAAAQTKVSRPGEEEGGCGGGSGSRLPSDLSIADDETSSINGAIRSSNKLGAAWARSPNHGIAYQDTWHLIEDLELHLRRLDSKIQDNQKERQEKKGRGIVHGVVDRRASADWEDGVDNKGQAIGRQRRGDDDLGSNYGAFKTALAGFREKCTNVQTPEQAFECHMAMGQCLLEHHWHEAAINSFELAVQLIPQDARAHFLMGNAYYSLGKYTDARLNYQNALEAGEVNTVLWQGLLPQVNPF